MSEYFYFSSFYLFFLKSLIKVWSLFLLPFLIYHPLPWLPLLSFLKQPLHATLLCSIFSTPFTHLFSFHLGAQAITFTFVSPEGDFLFLSFFSLSFFHPFLFSYARSLSSFPPSLSYPSFFIPSTYCFSHPFLRPISPSFIPVSFLSFSLPFPLSHILAFLFPSFILIPFPMLFCFNTTILSLSFFLPSYSHMLPFPNFSSIYSFYLFSILSLLSFILRFISFVSPFHFLHFHL